MSDTNPQNVKRIVGETVEKMNCNIPTDLRWAGETLTQVTNYPGGPIIVEWVEVGTWSHEVAAKGMPGFPAIVVQAARYFHLSRIARQIQTIAQRPIN